MAYKNYQEQLEASRQHYKENKAYYKQKTKDRARRLRSIMDEYKASNPCVDCCQYFPSECMDFDHTKGEKRFVLSKSENYSRQKVEAEIAKCDLVCANCHRIRTKHRRRNALDGLA